MGITRIQLPVCIIGQMVKRARPLKRQIPRRHLQFVGIIDKTLRRYTKEMTRFVAYKKAFRFPTPRSIAELDDLAADYINHLWQEGDS